MNQLNKTFKTVADCYQLGSLGLLTKEHLENLDLNIQLLEIEVEKAKLSLQLLQDTYKSLPSCAEL